MLQDFIKLTHIAEDFIVKELTLIMASFIKMLMDFIVPLHEFIKIKDFTLIK